MTVSLGHIKGDLRNLHLADLSNFNVCNITLRITVVTV